ncbi:MAG TPA: NUDIX hydrolase [Streptosporangiaceae bacterium]|jgi:ADP-ribose pyrophosphatase YjhB (NUDIX family)
MASDSDPQIPAIPVSAGALIFDRGGRLLILKPTYKSGWTIPGGVMEANGETPWQACQREVAEECGIDVHSGKLACVDFRPPRPGKPGGVRFLFDCGRVDDERLAAIVLQPEEISESRIAALPDAFRLLRGPIRRRVQAATGGHGVVYLEDGRPVPAVPA